MNKIASLLRRLLPPYSPESIATGFVGFFFIIGLVATLSYVGQEAVKQAAKPDTSQALIILGSLVAACFGFTLTILIAPSLGWLCSLPFMHRTVEEALSAALVMKEFGLDDDEMLMGFIRQRKVKVYRAKNKLSGMVSYDVPALLEPLFSLWVYFPYLPSKLIGANRICFDRKEIEPIKKLTLDKLLAAMPEALQAASDKEKDAIIESLRMEIQDLKESISDERRELKKRLTTAEKRINEYMLLVYVGARLSSHFHAERYGVTSISRFRASKQIINTSLDTLRHEEPLLDAELSLCQRFDKAAQDDSFYDFLRLGLPENLVNWGGYNMTFEKAVKKYLKRPDPEDVG